MILTANKAFQIIIRSELTCHSRISMNIKWLKLTTIATTKLLPIMYFDQKESTKNPLLGFENLSNKS